MRYTLRGKVWLYPGPPEGGGSWHFVNVSKKAAREIRTTVGDSGRGFGSIPVQVTVGRTSWRTSIFPDKASGTYLLPLKAEIRRQEQIEAGSTLSYTIMLLL